MDPLFDYFINKMKGCGLLDVALVKLCYTRQNKHAGTEGISKRFDHFFIIEDFFTENFRVH